MGDERIVPRPIVLLATCEDLPDGEPAHQALTDALAEQNIEARSAPWNNPTIKWDEADVVLPRTTWDYTDHLPAFLRWAEMVGTKLVPDKSVVSWNTNKHYLIDHARAGVPTIPTEYAANMKEVIRFSHRPGTWVVKPAIGVSGDGVEKVDDSFKRPTSKGPWLVQPFISSIQTDGEISIYVLGGNVTAQFQKYPKAGEIRVHQERGGRSEPVPVTEEAKVLAHKVVQAAEKLLGCTLHYARIDLLRMEGKLVVLELELMEFRLFLDVLPEHATAFAKTVATIVEQRRSDR